MDKRKLVSVGEHSYGNFIVKSWDDKTRLKIGKFCSIAEGVKFYLGGNHRVDWISTFPFKTKFGSNIEGHPATKGDIVVGNDVWIGENVIILSGVNIGDGAVIGNGCVVSKDIAPYSIVVGNPQKEIRKRFNEEEINILLEIKWWNWAEEIIRKYAHILSSNQIFKLKEINDE